MDIAGFGGLRPGLSSVFPGQNANALLREAATGRTGAGASRQPQEQSDLLNRPRGGSSLARGTDSEVTTSPRSGPAAVLSKAVRAAFDLIEDDLTGMFKTLGMNSAQAKDATDGLIASMEKAATTADAFRFSFSRAVARYARSDVAYSGNGGAVVASAESASLHVKSLDIYVNNKTGAFSVNYAEVSVSVEKSAIGAASGAGGTGLPFGGGGGDSGISDFIERMLRATTGNAGAGEPEGNGKKPANPRAPARESLSRQIFRAAEAALTAFEPDVADPGGSSDRFSRLRLDLSIPLGLLQRDAQGPVFQDADGRRSLLQAPKQAGIRMDA